MESIRYCPGSIDDSYSLGQFKYLVANSLATIIRHVGGVTRRNMLDLHELYVPFDLNLTK
jgi:hypothetical protein